MAYSTANYNKTVQDIEILPVGFGKLPLEIKLIVWAYLFEVDHLKEIQNPDYWKSNNQTKLKIGYGKVSRTWYHHLLTPIYAEFDITRKPYQKLLCRHEYKPSQKRFNYFMQFVTKKCLIPRRYRAMAGQYIRRCNLWPILHTLYVNNLEINIGWLKLLKAPNLKHITLALKAKYTRQNTRYAHELLKGFVKMNNEKKIVLETFNLKIDDPRLIDWDNMPEEGLPLTSFTMCPVDDYDTEDYDQMDSFIISTHMLEVLSRFKKLDKLHLHCRFLLAEEPSEQVQKLLRRLHSFELEYNGPEWDDIVSIRRMCTLLVDLVFAEKIWVKISPMRLILGELIEPIPTPRWEQLTSFWFTMVEELQPTFEHYQQFFSWVGSHAGNITSLVIIATEVMNFGDGILIREFSRLQRFIIRLQHANQMSNQLHFENQLVQLALDSPFLKYLDIGPVICSVSKSAVIRGSQARRPLFPRLRRGINGQCLVSADPEIRRVIERDRYYSRCTHMANYLKGGFPQLYPKQVNVTGAYSIVLVCECWLFL